MTTTLTPSEATTRAQRLLADSGVLGAVVELSEVPEPLAAAGFTTYLFRTPETAVAARLTTDNLNRIAAAIGGHVEQTPHGARLRFPTLDHRGRRQIGTAHPGQVLVRIDDRYLDPRRQDRDPAYITHPGERFTDHWYAPGHTECAGSPTSTQQED